MDQPYTVVFLFDTPEWRRIDLLPEHFEYNIEWLQCRDFVAHTVLPTDYLYCI